MNTLQIKNNIILTSDYETGNGENFKKVAAGHFSLAPKKDPEKVKGRPYGGLAHHFSFRIKNLKDSRQTVRIDVEKINHPFGPDACVWVKRGKSWKFAENVNCAVHWGEKLTRLSFKVNILGREEVEISESFNYSYKDVISHLNQALKRYPSMVHLSNIGKTAQGKDIPCLRIGVGGRGPAFMISATPQACEMGALGCFAAISALCSNDSWAKAARRKFVYYILPCTNPDGVDLGRCMVNSLGENPVFEARGASAGKKVSKEAKALWKFAEEISPEVFLGYHSYFQSHYFMTSLRPWGIYVFDRLLLRSPAKRKAADVLGDKILDLPFGQHSYVRLGDEGFSDALPYLLQEKSETLAYWLKLTTRMDFQANENKAVEVLKTITANYPK